jgi:flagellar biosynthetic protein FliP
MFVMAPVASDMVDAINTSGLMDESSGEKSSGYAQAIALYDVAGPPLLTFLKQNAAEGEVVFFSDLAGEVREGAGFRILLPAFAVGEIAEAFLMGFLLFLPFVVVDLIVAMVLSSLGMPMLSPIAVSLPLKLLLFVAVDGWHVILSGLLVNYGA